MLEEIKEECGLLGVYLKDFSKNSSIVPELLHKGMKKIQHRGQSGCGFMVYKLRKGKYGKPLDVCKGPGTVFKLFHDKGSPDLIYEGYKGVAGIAHTRYGTSGSRIGSVQPFHRRHGRAFKKFGIAFNGNITNSKELEKLIVGNRKDLEYILESEVDTELIMHLFSTGLKSLSDGDFENKPDFLDVAKYCMPKLDGAYNLLFMFANGELGVIRDPLGFKPLCYGENDDIFGISSERVALEAMGIKRNDINIFPPGGAMVVNKENVNSHGKLEVLFPNERRAYCHFEAIYFLDQNSDFEGKSVYCFRTDLGDEIARNEDKEILDLIDKNKERCVVVSAPDTSYNSAAQYAYRLNLPIRRGIRKIITDDEPKRNFINDPYSRPIHIEDRFSITPEVFNNNIVFIIEDSIVRSQTLIKLIELIYSSTTVDQIHVRVTEPPIIGPCFYGIDMSSINELVANRFPNAKDLNELNKNITELINADSFKYLTNESFDKCFGSEFSGKICKACINRKYPTTYGEMRFNETIENLNQSEKFEKYKYLIGM